jgi:hypothetical protein
MNDRADAGAARETTYPDASQASVGEGAVSRQTQGMEAGQVLVSTRRRGVRGRRSGLSSERLDSPAWALLSMPVLAAVVVWTISLQSVSIRDVGDAGIVTALPPAAFAALAVACLSFAVAVAQRRPSQLVLTLHLVLLIYMLYGASTLIEQVPTFNVSWRHAGIITSIVNHGDVSRETNAYFNWPSFFILGAFATKLAGLGSSPLSFIPWAPVVFELLYLAPLIVISRAVTSDPRLPWVAAWVFYLTNWVYQDYFSPQALAYFLYLALFAIVLRWFSHRREVGGRPFRRAAAATQALIVIPKSVTSALRVEDGGGAPHVASPRLARQRAALVAVCFLLVAAAVPTHQLTPYAILAGATALVVLRLCSFSMLPAIALVLTVTWSVFAAGPYLNGHLGAQVGPSQAGSLLSSVTGRVVGSQAHVVIAYLRLATTICLWGVAALVGLNMLRRRRREWLGHIALAAAPFGLMMLSAYGGEILLRVYLFSLPFVAALVASLLLAVAGRNSTWRRASVLGLAGLVLATGFLFTRYGNERANLFTRSEVQAVQHLYHIAPGGSVLAVPNSDLPWTFRGVRAYHYTTLTRELRPSNGPDSGPSGSQLAERVARALNRRGVPASYLVITRSNRQYDRVVGQATWGSVARLQRGVERSPSFRTVYATPDATIFQLQLQLQRRGEVSQ